MDRRKLIYGCFSLFAAEAILPPALAMMPAQHPDLLRGYKVRPPWQIAGIDFAVGHPATQELINVAMHRPAGTEYLNGTLTVKEDNVTIDGYDFTGDGGVKILCSSNNLTISNCRFGGPNYLLRRPNTGIIDFRGNGLSVFENTIDGEHAGGDCLLFLAGSGLGRVSIRYNWFKNFGSRLVELLADVCLDIRNNLIQDGGQGGSSVHMNYLEWDISDAVVAYPIWSYNTTYQQVQSGTGEGPQWYSNGRNLRFNSPRCSHNTVIAIGSGAMTYCFHGSNSGEVLGNAIIGDNYVDASGAFGAFYPASFRANGWTANGNIDLITGRELVVT
jgi:hypothetical protein